MPKISASDITNLGFIAAMFNKTADEFDAFVEEIIARQSPLLSGRIGAVAYASTASPIQENVIQAERCMVALELLKIRKITMLGNASGAGEAPDTAAIDASIKDLKEELNGTSDWLGLLATIINNGQVETISGFAVGVLVTDHFGATT